MKKSIFPTLSENFNGIKQTWHQLQTAFFFENRANTQIGIKCDFRDWTRIMFEVVANAMFD